MSGSFEERYKRISDERQEARAAAEAQTQQEADRLKAENDARAERAKVLAVELSQAKSQLQRGNFQREYLGEYKLHDYYSLPVAGSNGAIDWLYEGEEVIVPLPPKRLLGITIPQFESLSKYTFAGWDIRGRSKASSEKRHAVDTTATLYVPALDSSPPIITLGNYEATQMELDEAIDIGVFAWTTSLPAPYGASEIYYHRLEIDTFLDDCLMNVATYLASKDDVRS